MSLSPQFLDELRVRTALSALIGRSLKLQRAGREWKACCPFHNEKTPSFYVNDEKGFYHCFGCSAHGDAIRWLTDQKGLAFMDAVKELADAAGMDVPAPDPRAQEKAARAAGLHEVTEAAARWFAEQLGGIEGGPAREYLKGRGIVDATVARFGFGFAPDSRGKLRAALKAIGDEKLVEAGLLIQPEDGSHSAWRAGDEPYDRFRGRLMIPIRDPRGRTIAFGGRILGDGEPKYLNSPETPLFDKGRTLFNLDRAAAAARAANRILVVEGYMDVIALDQAGIGETVAPLGTALTEGQLGLLWRLSPTPLLCFDGDAAGQRAAARAALRALPHLGAGRSLAFVTLPPGQDPDDLVRARGRPALEKLLAAAEPLIERLWRHELEAEPVDTPERRAGLKQRLLGHAAAIQDAGVRDEYRAEFFRRFDERFRPARREWKPAQFRGGRFQPPPRPASAEARAVGSTGLDPQLARAVLQGLVRHPASIAGHMEAIAALPLADRELAGLRDLLLEAALGNAELDPETLHTILADKGAAALLERLARKRGLAFSFTRRDAPHERALRDLALVVETLAARPGIEAALAAATARLEEAGDEAAFAEQQRLRAARDEADSKLATLIEGDADQL